MEPGTWCYCTFEVPYRGVSSENPTGHLSLASRNKGEQCVTGKAFTSVLDMGKFIWRGDQAFLHGVLAILPFQLVFVPCVTEIDFDVQATNQIRQRLMQSLRRMQPGVQREWIDGLPGSIPLAKLDYLLAIDKRQRMYKFDPVHPVWSPTLDGIRKPVTKNLLGESKTIPHHPVRLILCTTDLEAYTFYPSPTSSSNDILTRDEKHCSKQHIVDFVQNVAARTSKIRSMSGISLASEFTPQIYGPSQSCVSSSTGAVDSIDPFLQEETTSEPIRPHALHPAIRMKQDWLRGSGLDPNDSQWVDNTDFSCCPTYPLQVPSVPLHESISVVRNFFDGNRFPVISFKFSGILSCELDISPISAPSYCLLIRSGAITSKMNLRSVINCSTSYGNHPDSPDGTTNNMTENLVCIRMREVSNTETLMDSLNVYDSVDCGDYFTEMNIANSVTSLQMPPTRKRPSRTPSFTANPCPSPGINWSCPRAKLLEQCWLRLGCLIRLSQLHTPITGSKRTSAPTPIDQLDALSCDDVLDGKKLGAIGIQRTQHMSAIFPDVDDGTSTTHTMQPNSVPFQRHINTLFAERNLHRSSWFDRFKTTEWSVLVMICLKQASALAELMRWQSTQNRFSYVVLCGPGTGRRWQCIITSLVQLILSPLSRTLSGFEDLIEREWVRLGYPFSPDPPDCFESPQTNDYETGASFALFLDCVHQMLYQFPVDFAFTEDYLVLLLETALSRGGGLPPFAIEFSCSCEAARRVASKSAEEVEKQSKALYERGALRSFRDWSAVLTPAGLQLIGNWCYWYNFQSLLADNPKASGISTVSQLLFPITIPSYLKLWIHGWFRWNRTLRLTGGGGYAYDAAFYRSQLCPFISASSIKPITSTTPYTGWLSDEAIICVESLQSDLILYNELQSGSLQHVVAKAARWEVVVDV